MDRILLQAVEDRDNPDAIEAHGPFYCSDKKAWLGPGYYFWEHSLEVAKWWGENIYGEGNYVVCRSSISESLNQIYDLGGNPRIIEEFVELAKFLSITNPHKVYFCSQIIEYLKYKTDFLRLYKGIRALPLQTRRITQGSRIMFHPKYPAYLYTRPEFQFCILDKSILIERYHIIYPPKYAEEEVIG
ncbi:MAG: hypothetical protein LIP03_12890 [Bacteroidales bacterium]|nr:hypothetical protein [Bacteroidales bacterium]